MEQDSDMNVIDEDAEMVGSDDEIEEKQEVNADAEAEVKVYLPGQQLEKDEELVCDESAYIMLHQAHTGAPCLSFDIIRDNLGDQRETYPLSAYIVAGTQAARAHVNSVIVMKMSNLHRITEKKAKEENEDEEGDSSDEELEDDDDARKVPRMDCVLIKHQGCINRIRSTTVNDTVFAASWSELGRVNIWNLNQQLQVVEDYELMRNYEKNKTGDQVKPVYTFTGHQQEGFAVDWCTTNPGVLATGDCRRDIHIWTPHNSEWKVDQRPLVGHTDSVEDLQWSPNERSVLASCSVDKSLRIWDIRAPPNKACMLTCDNAHTSDVNVITWNRKEPLIGSGGDDGILHVWDLRQFQNKTPIATFKHHTNHVTTIEWHPTNSSVLASGGADDQIALWDLSVERDAETSENGDLEADNETQLTSLPPQLLFIHQGQKDIKELHWHPQLPGVIMSTAHSGFNVFRTISV